MDLQLRTTFQGPRTLPRRSTYQHPQRRQPQTGSMPPPSRRSNVRGRLLLYGMAYGEGGQDAARQLLAEADGWDDCADREVASVLLRKDKTVFATCTASSSCHASASYHIISREMPRRSSEPWENQQPTWRTTWRLRTNSGPGPWRRRIQPRRLFPHEILTTPNVLGASLHHRERRRIIC